MCASIAREVCEHLFGDKIDEVSVRTIIAEVVAPDRPIDAHKSAYLEAALERDGVETIHTHCAPSEPPKPAAPAAESHPAPAASVSEPIAAAHALLAQKGLKLGLFPMWELKKGASNSLFLTAFTGNGTGALSTGTSRLLAAEAQIVDIEISHLLAAAAYAARMRAEQKVCAVAVGVSYNTLGSFRSRIRYMAALQAAVFPSSNPLLVRIEQIPEGAPDGRIAEFAAMLTPKNVRVSLEFCSLATLRRIDIRLGVMAMGGTLPADHVLAQETAERLIQKTMIQKSFSFLENLDSPQHLALANRANIRFGRGLALSNRHFSGLEPVPAFPLVLARTGSVALV
jgi:hypothetical protein